MGFDPKGVFFCPEPEIQLSSVIFNEKDISRAVTRIAHEILEKNKGADKLALVGIRTRGATLAQRLAKKINEIESTSVSLGILDITLYRDDLGTSKQSHSTTQCYICDINTIHFNTIKDIEVSVLTHLVTPMRTKHKLTK